MFATILNTAINIASFLFILGILVLVHEWGHFWVARKCGVKVEEFAFGLPPRLWGKKKGDTLYAINAIPFGGYVKMLGQDDFDPKAAVDTPRTADHFEAKTWWQKALILCAGVAMNVLLAIVLFSIGYMVGMKPLIPDSPLFNQALERNGVIIREIQKDSLGESIGIPNEGKIEKINNTTVKTTAQLHELIGKYKNAGFSLTIDNQTYGIPALKENEKIGLAYGENMTLKEIQLPPHQAIYYGAVDSVLILRETFASFGKLITQLFTKLELSQEVTGPVGIFKLTAQVTQNGFIPFLQLIALLSLSLAAVNIIPFPALDGGRLFFVLLESIFPKRWNKLIEGKVHLIGMMLLLLFMLAITYKDIVKLFN
ncbi:MAG: site-2 protease family protein [Candidatus Abawacabacteria bacterium]|nr:site-2 protease family protein [Candidatus Abawacabacteria bacterium]